MRKIIYYIFYNKKTGKLDLGITFLLGFLGLVLLTLLFILLMMFLFRDNMHRVDRLDQQIINSEIIQNKFPYPFSFGETVDFIESDTITHEMIILEKLERNALIFYSYRGKEYDWKVDTVIVIKVVPNKDRNELRKYRINK